MNVVSLALVLLNVLVLDLVTKEGTVGIKGEGEGEGGKYPFETVSVARMQTGRFLGD